MPSGPDLPHHVDGPHRVDSRAGTPVPGPSQVDMVLKMGLGADPGEVARVRHLLEQRLHRWESTVPTDVAVLLTSELVTNAILHGSPPLELRALGGDGTLRVEVHDARRLDTLAARTAAGDAESGRGLVLVDALATRWGWDRHGRRKYVWFELDG